MEEQNRFEFQFPKAAGATVKIPVMGESH